jgi:hypothetical protein
MWLPLPTVTFQMIDAVTLHSKYARLLIGLLLLCAIFGGRPADAQAPLSYAGIVIHPGDGTVTYAYVPLDEPVSGIELLRLSGISLVTVGFGGLGEGVCQIEESGCDVGPCRVRLCQTGDRNSPYWRYFQQDESGVWVASPLGGSATKIAPGEIDGWSWTPDEGGLPGVELVDIPTLARAGTDLGAPHFAQYDANGVFVKPGASTTLTSNSTYLLVGAILAGVALFALLLRFRPRSAV